MRKKLPPKRNPIASTLKFLKQKIIPDKREKLRAKLEYKERDNV